MKDSFIGNKEITEYLDTLEKDKENSIFNYTNDNFEELSVNKELKKQESLINNILIKETPYRFVIVLLYCLLSFSNGFQWVTFAAIGNKFKQVYDISTVCIDMFSMVYMIAYPFVTFPSSYLISNLTLAAIGTILAAGFKVFLNQGIAFAYIGQIIAAIVQPLILNSPGELAATWFRDERRVLTTSICCMANTLGIIFGYILPIFFVDDEMNNDEYKNKIGVYLFWEFILSVSLCFPTLILMKSKPIFPPSKSQNNYESPPFKECIHLLINNKNFIYMLIALTGIMGYINLCGTIVNEYLAKYNLNAQQTSLVSGISNIFGIGGCILTSIIIDKYKMYRKPFIILNMTAIIMQASYTLLLELYEEYAFILSLLSYVVVNGTTIPIYACTMDYVAEQTYPVGASISGGIIMSVNQISGIISILICDYFLDYLSQYRYLTNLYILVILMIIPLIALILMKEELNRHKKDIAN